MALADSSAAFSWKPNGVSRRTAETGGGPSRSNTSRWVFTIVGLVSPEPMMTSSRGDSATEEPVAGFVQHRGHVVGVLGVDVVVGGGEPVGPRAGQRALGGGDVVTLLLGPRTAVIGGEQQHRHRHVGVDLRRRTVPHRAEDL